MDFLNIAERLGIPFTVLCMLAFAIWRVLKWTAKVVVAPVAQAHIELVNETKKANVTNTATLNKVTDILAQNSTMVSQLVDGQNQVIALSKDTNTKVNALIPQQKLLVTVNTIPEPEQKA